MKEQTCNVFFRDEVDNRTKVICVFDASASDEEMIKVVSEYLEENEMDDTDEYAPIQSKIDCDVYAKSIVKGKMLDFDLDRYWIEKDVVFFTK